MGEEFLEHGETVVEPPPLTDGEMVHWMDRKPLRVGPAGLSAVALAGFAAGVGATLSVLALCGWIGPERDLPPARPRRP